MNYTTATQFDTLRQQGETSPEAALNLFDELDGVSIPFMIGRWIGSGFPTHHPMDGLLEATGWYGKEFLNADEVHPLLMTGGRNQVFKLAPQPALMRLSTRLPTAGLDLLQPWLRLSSRLFKPEQSQARLRTMEYRGKLSACMIYDHLPIHDVFRKVDPNTVLGLMDYKGMDPPFFFVLKRELDQATPPDAADPNA